MWLGSQAILSNQNRVLGSIMLVHVRIARRRLLAVHYAVSCCTELPMNSMCMRIVYGSKHDGVQKPVDSKLPFARQYWGNLHEITSGR